MVEKSSETGPAPGEATGPVDDKTGLIRLMWEKMPWRARAEMVLAAGEKQRLTLFEAIGRDRLRSNPPDFPNLPAADLEFSKRIQSIISGGQPAETKPGSTQ